MLRIPYCKGAQTVAVCSYIYLTAGVYKFRMPDLGKKQFFILKANFILYTDQKIHNYFTNYYTHTCFDTIASSSVSS